MSLLGVQWSEEALSPFPPGFQIMKRGLQEMVSLVIIKVIFVIITATAMSVIAIYGALSGTCCTSDHLLWMGNETQRVGMVNPSSEWSSK
jgi:hypothetical protein